ncbi:MAG: ABC transporter permease [Candidatus Omnitrophota bacterium]
MSGNVGKNLSDKLLMLSGKLGPVFALILVIAIFGSIKPDLVFSFQNFSNVFGQTVVIAIAAVGMTFIIVSGGIDLSVGSLVALAGVFCAIVISTDRMAGWGMGLSMGILAALATGAVCGLLNGFLITRGKLAPFIVTLGMMEIVRGVALQSVAGLPVYGMPSDFIKVGNAVWEITLLESRQFSEDEIKWRGFAIRLKESGNSLEIHLREQLSDATKALLAEYNPSASPSQTLIDGLLIDMNRIVQGGLLYNQERFANVSLPASLQKKIAQNPQGKKLAHLNRLLLEEAYPSLVNKGDSILLIPYSVFILIPLALAAGFALKYTVFGIQTYAVGSSEQTARLCGVNVERVKLIVYFIGGVTAGLAGVLHASRLNSGQPMEAMGMELEVIAAVVIGGGSLMGGEGTILGSIMGAFIIKFLRNGCNLVEISSFVQKIVIGCIIIGAVYLDQLRRKSLARKSGTG